MAEVASRFHFSLFEIYQMRRQELEFWQDLHRQLSKSEEEALNSGKQESTG